MNRSGIITNTTWEIRVPDVATLRDSAGATSQPFSYAQFSQVPIPAAIWLFGFAVLGLVGFRRRQSI